MHSDKDWVPQDILPHRIQSARLLIAQAEELAKLRAALREAIAYLDDQSSVGTAADVARIAELRRLADGE